MNKIADDLNEQGVALAENQVQTQATKAWELALNVEPYHPEAFYNLQLLRWRNGQITDQQMVDQLAWLSYLGVASWKVNCLQAMALIERGDILTVGPALHRAAQTRQRLSCMIDLAWLMARLPQELTTVQEQRNWPAWSLAITPDGKRLVAGRGTLKTLHINRNQPASAYAPLEVWDLDGFERLYDLLGYPAVATSVCVSNDGTLGACGTNDGNVVVWHMDSGEHLATMEGHRGWVNCAQFYGAQNILLSAGNDATLHAWDYRKSDSLRSFTASSRVVGMVCEQLLSLASAHVYVLGTSGALERIKLTDFSPAGKVNLEANSPITASTFQHTPLQVITGHENGNLVFHTNLNFTTNKATTRTIPAHGGSITSLSSDPKGGWLVSAGADGHLKIWDLKTSRCMLTYPLDERMAGDISALAVAPDRSWLAIGDEFGRLTILQTKDLGAPNAPWASDAQWKVISEKEALRRLESKTPHSSKGRGADDKPAQLTLTAICQKCGTDATALGNSDSKLEEFYGAAEYMCESCGNPLHKIMDTRPQGYSLLTNAGKVHAEILLYAAWHNATGRLGFLELALHDKVPVDNPTAWRGRGIGIQRSLSHTGLRRVFDTNITRGFFELIKMRDGLKALTGSILYFCVYENVMTKSLYDIVNASKAPTSLEDALRWMLPVFDGVQLMHDKGFIHANIAPQHIFPKESKESGPARLDGFELARKADKNESATTELPEDLMKSGFPLFMAPEVLKKAWSSAISSDVFSLGATLYYLFSKQALYDINAGDTPVQVVQKRPVVPLQDHRTDLPAGMAEVINRAVRKEASDRWRSVAEFKDALLNSLNNDH